MISPRNVFRSVLTCGVVCSVFLTGCKTSSETNTAKEAPVQAAAVSAPVSSSVPPVADEMPASPQVSTPIPERSRPKMYKITWIEFQVSPESMKVLGDSPDQYDVLLKMTREDRAAMTVAVLPVAESKTAILTAVSKIRYPENYSDPFQLKETVEEIEPVSENKNIEPTTPAEKVTKRMISQTRPEGTPIMAPQDFVMQELGWRLEVTPTEFSPKEVNLSIRPQNVVCASYPGEKKDAVGYPSQPEFQNFEVTTELSAKLGKPTLVACFPAQQGDKKQIARLYYIRVDL